MPYLLYEKTRSNHKNIIGLFEQKSQAEICKIMKLQENPAIATLIIMELNFMDASPEITQFALTNR